MITKKQLGILFITVGIIAIVGSFAIDLVGAGEFQGIGPTQRLGLMGAGGLIVIGLTLLPFGDKPA